MRLTALCLVGALLAALLRRTGGEMALLLALAVCGAAVMLLAQPLEELKGFWEEAASWGQLPVQLFVPLVKTVGIALLCRTGSDLCRDAGEGSAALCCELAGTFAALCAVLPLLRQVLSLIGKMAQ